MQSPWLRNEQENAIVGASTPVKRTVSESNKLLQGRVEVDGSRPGLVQSCFDRQKGFSSGPRGCCCFFAPPPPAPPPFPGGACPFGLFWSSHRQGLIDIETVQLEVKFHGQSPTPNTGNDPGGLYFLFFGVCFSRNEIFVGVHRTSMMVKCAAMISGRDALVWLLNIAAST